MKHYAVYGDYFSGKRNWLQHLLSGHPAPEMQELEGKEGALFSDLVLEKFIEEDHRHGSSGLTLSEERSLQTYSSGEKRKALLRYLLNQHPDFLILDSPFDCLDKASVVTLKKELQELSGEIPMVQLLKRKEDLLPFITEVFLPDEERTISVKEFLNSKEGFSAETDQELIKIPSGPEKHFEVPEILVELKDVSVDYGEKPVLKNINWAVRKGEFWQLSGPNGSGKTTLLDMIYGDNPKAYGVDLSLFGKRKGTGESVWDIKKKIGYFSPAITSLYNRTHTLEQMLVSGLVDSVGLYQKPSDAQLSLARRWLSALNLLKEKDKPFRAVSLLKQRLILVARAMIKHPPLLILDEPSTSLDENAARVLAQLVNFFAQQSETSILYVSHREEKAIKSQFTYQLVPSKEGSTGRVLPD